MGGAGTIAPVRHSHPLLTPSRINASPARPNDSSLGFIQMFPRLCQLFYMRICIERHQSHSPHNKYSDQSYRAEVKGAISKIRIILFFSGPKDEIRKLSFQSKSNREGYL
jgi:hypothetical protein